MTCRSYHRYQVDNGLLNFWAPIADSVAYRTDNIKELQATQSHVPDLVQRVKPLKRVICSCCGSHVGYVFEDGPHPFFRRFTASSGSFEFKQKPWARPPVRRNLVERMYANEVRRVLTERKKNIERVETMLKLVPVKPNPPAI